LADIFVSYTSKDRDWAFWIGQELEKLGHVVHLDAWEIPGGGNIMAWMQGRIQKADHALCVISQDYFEGPFASAEEQSALWAGLKKRKNFVLPARITDCELPPFLAPLRHCDLWDVNEDEARARLIEFLNPAGRPSTLATFPGVQKRTSELKPRGPVAFPGTTEHSPSTISNIPINVPRHFFGREDDLAAIDAALKKGDGRAAVTALHGLRGVGKTTLAAAYAEQHKFDHRATWWIRAETDVTMRADLVGLGVQLDWIKEDAPEATAVKTVLDRLTREGTAILLIYDNATNSRELLPFLPRGAGPRTIITSNAPNWRGVASPVEIEVWPEGVGAEFLIARTGRPAEHGAAVALSDALGGLPLAHEQAAAYCERVGVSLGEYKKRFDAAPSVMLDSVSDAAGDYHDGLTVAKTIGLAIAEAAKQHPAAASLIVYAALLAPEPIPLFLFSEGRQALSEPFAASTKGGGLDEAVAALRAFALIDRESIVDERNPTISTECIRLHRLVREIVAARIDVDAEIKALRELNKAVANILPERATLDPATWPRIRRFEAIALPLAERSSTFGDSDELTEEYIKNELAIYRQSVLTDYETAQQLFESVLKAYERRFGTDHPNIAIVLNNLGGVSVDRGDLERGREYFERALEMVEKTQGEDHPDLAPQLNNLGTLLEVQGDLQGAQLYHQRALAIREKMLPADHPDLAVTLNNLGHLLVVKGELVNARPYYERALAIRERIFEADHTSTATSLNNFGILLEKEGDLVGARPYYERALTIFEKVLGIDHPNTMRVAENTALLFDELGLLAEAAAIRQKFGL
jgi:tetratricopeptide (TPR) repeat protein